MRRRLDIVSFVAAVLVLGIVLLFWALRSDPLPPEIWVLGGASLDGEMGPAYTEPGGPRVDYGSIATNGVGIALWYQPSRFRKLLWRFGVGGPIGGADYDPTGRTAVTEEGIWHHHVRATD